MKKLRFFGLLVTVVLLAFSMAAGCSNGSTDEEKEPQGTLRTNVYSGTVNGQAAEITISESRDAAARVRQVDVPEGGDFYVAKLGGSSFSSGTVAYETAQKLNFNPSGEGESFYGTLVGGALTIQSGRLQGAVLNKAGGSGIDSGGDKRPTAPIAQIDSGIPYRLEQVGGTAGTVTSTAIRFYFDSHIGSAGLTLANIEFLNGTAVKGEAASLAGAGTSWTLTFNDPAYVKSEGALRLKINRAGISYGEREVGLFKVAQSITVPQGGVYLVVGAFGTGTRDVAYSSTGIWGSTGPATDPELTWTSSDRQVVSFAGAGSIITDDVSGANPLMAEGAGRATITVTGMGDDDGTVLRKEFEVVVASALTNPSFEIDDRGAWESMAYFHNDDKTVVWKDATVRVFADELGAEGVPVAFNDPAIVIFSNANPFAPAVNSRIVSFVGDGTVIPAAAATSLTISVAQDSVQSLSTRAANTVRFDYFQGFHAAGASYTNIDLIAQWGNTRAANNGVETFAVAADGTVVALGLNGAITPTHTGTFADYAADTTVSSTWAYPNGAGGTVTTPALVFRGYKVASASVRVGSAASLDTTNVFVNTVSDTATALNGAQANMAGIVITVGYSGANTQTFTSGSTLVGGTYGTDVVFTLTPPDLSGGLASDTVPVDFTLGVTFFGAVSAPYTFSAIIPE